MDSELITTTAASGTFLASALAVAKYLMRNKLFEWSVTFWSSKQLKATVAAQTIELEHLRCHQKYLQAELESARQSAMKIERKLLQLMTAEKK